MGGPNLEVFKFGMYIMFPIGWMYYFGTNLDSKFSIPDFWPRPEQQHRIPFERDEIESELERLKRRRLELRARRLKEEGVESDSVGSAGVTQAVSGLSGFGGSKVGGPLDQVAENAARDVKKSWGQWITGR